MRNCFKHILIVRIRPLLITVIVCSIISLVILQVFITPGTNLSNLPTILWWTPFLYENKKIIVCEHKYRCVVTKNRTLVDNFGTYLFYGSNFNETDLPLPRGNIPWAIFHEESPKNLAFFLHKEGQKLFNITSTFSRYSDLPLIFQYLEDLNLITDTAYYVPIQQKNKLLTKLAPVLYIQSDCQTPIERDFYVSELMKYIPIDSYGSCLHNKYLPEEYSMDKILTNLYDDSFMKFVAQYKFIIAIENSVCNDYITEKLWRPLIVGSIPIYLGSPKVRDWLPHNQSAILISDYKTIADLADYLKYVNSNDQLYEKYVSHKLSQNIENELLKEMFTKGSYDIHKTYDFPIHAFECFVCKTIHEQSFRHYDKSVYDCEDPRSKDPNETNWWISHWNLGKCQAKSPGSLH